MWCQWNNRALFLKKPSELKNSVQLWYTILPQTVFVGQFFFGILFLLKIVLQPVGNWILREGQLWTRGAGSLMFFWLYSWALGCLHSFPFLFRAGALYTATPLASEAPGMQAFSICCCRWQSPLAFLAHPHLSSNCLGHFSSIFHFPKGVLYLSSLSKLFPEVTNWIVYESLGDKAGEGALRNYYDKMHGKTINSLSILPST